MQLPHTANTNGSILTTDLTPTGTILVPAIGAALVGGLVNMIAHFTELLVGMA